MKFRFSKIVSLALALVLVFSCFAICASAITWDTVPAGTTYASRYWSSYYYGSKFYNNMTKVPLTGDGRRDTVAVALSQVGYIEGDSRSEEDGESGGSGNYTEYGYYAGCNAGAWCAAFCSWSYYTAQVTNVDGGSYDTNSGNIYADTYVPDWSSYLVSQGRYKTAYQFRNDWEYGYLYDASYVPQPGDLVFFYTSSEDYPTWEGHIGLVAYTEGSTVYTIEGNTSSGSAVVSEGGGAFFKSYDLYGSKLVGFGSMPFNSVSDLPPIDYTGANPTPGIYVTATGDVSVYAERDDSTPTWTLPMSSLFEVTKIEQDTYGYTMLYSKCEINGVTVNGWIPLNIGSRTIQIYASGNTTPELESNTFEIGSDNTVSGILPGATVSSLLSGVSSSDSATSVKVYNGNTAVANTAALKTGMTVKIFNGNEEVNSYDVVVKGDVNGDGIISGMDYMLAKRHVLGVGMLNGAYKKAAAVTGASSVSSNDYITLKRIVLGTYTLK